MRGLDIELLSLHNVEYAARGEVSLDYCGACGDG